MNVVLRLLSLLTSARNARETIAAARNSAAQLKATADGFRTAAFQRTREKAERGEAAAQYELGEYYYEGRVVAQDYGEAYRWFCQAAEQRHAKAQANAGMMCFLGRGVERNLGQAHRWLRLAAAQGDEAAIKAFEKVRQKMTPEELETAERGGWSQLHRRTSMPGSAARSCLNLSRSLPRE